MGVWEQENGSMGTERIEAAISGNYAKSYAKSRSGFELKEVEVGS